MLAQCSLYLLLPGELLWLPWPRHHHSWQGRSLSSSRDLQPCWSEVSFLDKVPLCSQKFLGSLVLSHSAASLRLPRAVGQSQQGLTP